MELVTSSKRFLLKDIKSHLKGPDDRVFHDRVPEASGTESCSSHHSAISPKQNKIIIYKQKERIKYINKNKNPKSRSGLFMHKMKRKNRCRVCKNASGSRWANGTAFCSRQKGSFHPPQRSDIKSSLGRGRLRKSKSRTASVRLGNLSWRLLKHIFGRFGQLVIKTGINEKLVGRSGLFLHKMRRKNLCRVCENTSGSRWAKGTEFVLPKKVLSTLHSAPILNRVCDGADFGSLNH
ncbi:hypothetical protein CEXT_375341 [Caerostris extrusa]|uniref:Uncharacterized protein n=1 Tax=Caerostris extrusa TaxID=172846 RepID=A0AAV4XER7_CAEEX|nr:hypothetical protein CEXT_375341 [Caerostris extrusa]